MKYKDFNKLGGTEFRTQHQADEYFKIFNWYKDNYVNFIVNKDKKVTLDLNTCNEEFKRWTKNEELYLYNDSSINRFGMIFKNFKYWGLIDENYNPIQYELNEKHSDEWLLNQIFSNYLPFNKAMNFLLRNNENTNIDYKNFYIVFSVIEENEDFEHLYNLGYENIIREIANSNINRIIEKNDICCNYRKPPKYKNDFQYLFEVFKNNNQNQINIDEFSQNFWSSNLAKNISITIKNNKNVKVDKKRYIINSLKQLTLEDFLYKFEFIRINDLLFNEYFDLFSRWMKDLHLINSKNDVIITLRNIEYVNNIFSIKKDNIQYPYSIEQTINFLNRIDNQDYSFKNDDPNLQNVLDSALAEYFVNLYMGHILKINPNDFNKYSHTTTNSNLYPTFTAPGNMVDFEYKNEENEQLYVVETTIHNNPGALMRKKLEPTTRHYKKYWSQ